MSDENFSLIYPPNHGNDSSNIWKAVAIGLAVGAVVVVGTAVVVANHISDEDGLDGAALITATLAAIGGGSKESGGDGMVGGLINLCIAGAGGVIVGTTGSIIHDNVSSFDDQANWY